MQRVPETESAGRIHTSTATVAVMPEAEDVEVEIDESDLKIDVYRSSGPGGQSVNTTHSAVRTSPADGTVVAMQDERSQLQNRENRCACCALTTTRPSASGRRAEQAAARSAEVGTGEPARRRSAPTTSRKNRVTDHRV